MTPIHFLNLIVQHRCRVGLSKILHDILLQVPNRGIDFLGLLVRIVLRLILELLFLDTLLLSSLLVVRPHEHQAHQVLLQALELMI